MSSGASASVLDALISSAGQVDPYPLYRELLAAGSIHQGGPDGAWYTFGYEACRQVLVDRGCGCRVPTGHQLPTAGRLQASMVMNDPPEHARLRRAISWAFTPAEVQPLRHRIVTLTDRALDAMADRGGGDVIAELAYPLPAAVIGELLGLSPEDAEQFQALAALSVAVSRAGDEASLAEQAARDADARLAACFHELIESRRQPAADVLGRLVALSASASWGSTFRSHPWRSRNPRLSFDGRPTAYRALALQPGEANVSVRHELRGLGASATGTAVSGR
jgi:cytochrome P450